MARSHKVLVLVLLAACGSDSPVTPQGVPDAKSAVCASSADCTLGHWCNPRPVDSDPTDTICEPRGSIFSFDGDIYPTLSSQCAGCHVAGVSDSQGGTITVFAGGPDVAFASLTGAGTDCRTTAHKICVNEPKSSTTVARLLTHLNAQNTPGSKLVPMGYSDAFLQKYLHWIAAGATRSGATPDAPFSIFDAPAANRIDAPFGTPDAPIVIGAPDAALPPDAPPPRPDAGLPDARLRPDSGPDNTPPTGGNVTAASVDSCGLVTVTLQQGSDNATPVNMLDFEVCWSTVANGCETNFVALATFGASGMHDIDLSSAPGSTLFFAGRVVDLRGNGSVPTETHSVAIPTFLNWSPGGVNVSRNGGSVSGATSYTVTWPAVSSSCVSQPLNVQATCSGGSGCSCAVAGDNQSATCSTNSCEPIVVSVTASVGAASENRQSSFAMSYADVSPIFTQCRGCHPVSYPDGPQFTTADIGRTASVHCNASFIYIKPGDPDNSMEYGVVSAHHWLCDPPGVNEHTFNTLSTADHALLLHCYIDGVPPQ